MEKYVLKKAEIDASKGTQKSHYLNPKARRINRSLGDLTGLTGFGFHLIEVRPGDETTELHTHYHEDECVYVLEGEAQATLGRDVFTLGAGDFIGYRAGGLAHKLKNTGTSILKCIVVGQRLAHDVADYPDLNKRLFRNPGTPWNLVDIENISEPQAGGKMNPSISRDKYRVVPTRCFAARDSNEQKFHIETFHVSYPADILLRYRCGQVLD